MAEEHETDKHTSDKREDDASTGTFPQVTLKSRAFKERSNTRRISMKVLTTVLIVLLCALVGIGYVTQQKNLQTSYSTMSEDELVQLLDTTNNTISSLQEDQRDLQDQLHSLQSELDSLAAANQTTKQHETTDGILSGRLPAEGPGIVLTIMQNEKQVDASSMFNVIEELRNAGAEVIQVGPVRVVTSTSFTDTADGLMCDGIPLTAPYTIMAIGNPGNLQNAIEIAGGVKSRLSVQFDADVNISQKTTISITKVRKTPTYTYATTVD
jgi:uncharacterized protein YlxW (UPF0749 family)